jgi:hypothetical protein
MENVSIFSGHLEYITADWYISWTFSSVHSGNLVYIFSTALVYCVNKNLQNKNVLNVYLKGQSKPKIVCIERQH